MTKQPTHAQVICARKIHQKLGIAMPAEFTRQAYWKYINENLEKSKPSRSDYTVNGESGVAEIVLAFDRIPAHCGECQLYIENAYFDEDGFFGDCVRHSCPFGCQTFGCLVNRPPDCPITPVNRGDT